MRIGIRLESDSLRYSSEDFLAIEGGSEELEAIRIHAGCLALVIACLLGTLPDARVPTGSLDGPTGEEQSPGFN